MAGQGFDAHVAPGGYRWWYLDAMSDDGRNGLTIIGFVGSVFSPYYKRARRKGEADPSNHCAINVALYGAPRRWAMTERGASRVSRSEHHFEVGPSSLEWSGQGLTILLDERCAPLPFALQGKVTFTPGEMYNAPVSLDAAGRHKWQAVAPAGRVTAEFRSPALRWSGSGYHDMNWGDEPLEDAFRHWTWLRAHTTGGAEVHYHVDRRDGSHFGFGKHFRSGKIEECTSPPLHRMPKGFWGMERSVASESRPSQLTTLEDAPFYTRNKAAITLGGKSCEAFHESLSLDRFKNPVVQVMLPFRMPRIARGLV